MLKKLLIGLLAIAAIVVSIGTRQGSSFTVARSIDIRAAPATIAPLPLIGMDVLLGAELEKGHAGVQAVAETPHPK
jgi:hypothetical protein